MDKTIRNVARRCAIAVFFLMAVTGWIYGQEPAICAWRGALGAAAMYGVVRAAAAVIIHVLIDVMAQSEAQRVQQKDNS